MNLFEYLFAMHSNSARSAYTQAYLFAPHFQNRDLYLITNHNTLVRFTS